MNLADTFDKPWCALVRKELLIALRKKRTFGFVLAAGVIASIGVISGWPSGESIVDAAEFSAILSAIVAGVISTGCWFIIPVITSASVINELEQNTSESIWLTLLRSKDVVAGKLLNSIGLVILLLLSLLPLFAAAFFLVGLDWIQITGTGIILLSSVMEFGAIGLLAGTVSRTVRSAVMLSYGIMFVLGIGTRILQSVFAYLGFWTPGLTSLLMGFGTGGVWGQGSSNLVPALVMAAINLGIALVCCWWASRRIWRPAKDRGIKDVDLVSGDGAVKKKREFRRGVWVDRDWNPILLKEILTETSSRRWTVISGVILITGLPLIVTVVSGMPKTIPMTAYILGYVAILFCPGTAEGGFNSEKERETFDLLRMTLLRPKDVVIGHLLRGMVQISPLLVPLTGWFALSGAFGIIPIGKALFVSALLILACGEIIALTVLFSMLTKRVSGTIIWTFVFLFITTALGGIFLRLMLVGLSSLGLYGLMMPDIFGPEEETIEFGIMFIGIVSCPVRILFYLVASVDFYRGRLVDP